jgi:glutaredoxin
MALIEIQKRCDDCEKTRRALEDLRREVQNVMLDYNNLYEKVRTNLGKLAKRVRESEKEPEGAETAPQDDLAQFRSALVARKLGRRG